MISSPISSPISGAQRAILGQGAGGASYSLPASPDGSWFARDYLASPRPHIPNRSTATAVSQHLGYFTKNHFELWARTNVTLTNGVTGPDGNANWTRVLGTGNWLFQGPQQTFATGSYVTVAEVASNTGLTQPVKYGNSSAPSVADTIPVSQGRLTTTFTRGSTGTVFIGSFGSSDGVTGCDFLIRSVEVFSGSVDPGQQPADAGHMYFGNTAYAALPTVSANEVDYAGSGTSWAAFPTRQSVSEFTVMAAIRKTSDVAARIVGAIRRGATSVSSDDLGLFSDYTSSGWRSTAYQFGADFTPVALLQKASTAMWQLLNRDYFILTWRYKSGVASIWVNDSEMFSEVVSRSAVNLQDFLILNGQGKLSNIHIWFRGCTDAEIESGVGAMQAELTASGLTIGTNNLFIAWIGDSQFAGATVTAANAVPYIYAPNAPSPYVGAVYAASGARLSGTGTHVQAQITNALRMAPAEIGSRKFIAVIQVGANDNAQIVAATYLATLAGYCDSLRAVGIKVVLSTLTNRRDALADPGFDTWRTTINSTITSSWIGVHCDAVADIGSDATMGGTTAPDDTTYFSDKLHYTAAGQVIWEALVRAQVNALAA